MDGFDRLELSTETLRELTRDELASVAGGEAITTNCGYLTQTPACPSGATWFAPCNSDSVRICDD